LELPRGMKDFVDSETANIEHIRSHFKQLSNLYGFSFMDPSPIELLSTLETKSGPAIKDEIYYFKAHKICYFTKIDEITSKNF